MIFTRGLRERIGHAIAKWCLWKCLLFPMYRFQCLYRFDQSAERLIFSGRAAEKSMMFADTPIDRDTSKLSSLVSDDSLWSERNNHEVQSVTQTIQTENHIFW